MTQGHRPLATVLLAASFILSVVGVGCAGRVSYRAYDPGYNDYHAWDSHERVYYNQWTTETHRSNKDFRSWAQMTRRNIGIGVIIIPINNCDRSRHPYSA